MTAIHKLLDLIDIRRKRVFRKSKLLYKYVILDKELSTNKKKTILLIILLSLKIVFYLIYNVISSL